MKTTKITPRTIKVVSSYLRSAVELDLIQADQAKEVEAQLSSLAKSHKPLADIRPKFLTQSEVADLLGLSVANFKRQEKLGRFPFKRRIVGESSVRYSNIDVYNYILGR